MTLGAALLLKYIPSGQLPDALPLPWLVTMHDTRIEVPDTPDTGSPTLTGGETMSLTTDLSDFGTPVAVTAPAASDVFDATGLATAGKR